ncbi:MULTISPECIES: DMT family transporter [unclassified Exiguobacterium]|uniref:DMT family transporter n=1 Tax=unclassified Exiguobacterium TaxID=2644629 RepID=UPI001BECF8DB|nr:MULTISPECIES: DMT family transporter [unclassified Exiguobacterium]
MKKILTHPVGMVVFALFTTLLWGSAFPFIKKSYELLAITSSEYGEQLLFASYRFFLAGVLLLIVSVLIFKQPITLKKRAYAYSRLGFFLTFLQYVFFYIGLSLSTGVQGSIIAGSTSFFQMLLAHFRYEDDRLNRFKGLALFLGFTGVILANWPQGAAGVTFGVGEILLICAMISGAFANLIAKEYSAVYPVAPMTGWAMVIGSIGLFIAGAVLNGQWFPFHFTQTTAWMLFYLAFLSATGFTLWNLLMKYNPVSRVSLFMFFVPIYGVSLSALILGETIPPQALLGLVFVVSGILVSTYLPVWFQKRG